MSDGYWTDIEYHIGGEDFKFNPHADSAITKAEVVLQGAGGGGGGGAWSAGVVGGKGAGGGGGGAGGTIKWTWHKDSDRLPAGDLDIVGHVASGNSGGDGASSTMNVADADDGEGSTLGNNNVGRTYIAIKLPNIYNRYAILEAFGGGGGKGGWADHIQGTSGGEGAPGGGTRSNPDYVPAYEVESWIGANGDSRDGDDGGRGGKNGNRPSYVPNWGWGGNGGNDGDDGNSGEPGRATVKYYYQFWDTSVVSSNSSVGTAQQWNGSMWTTESVRWKDGDSVTVKATVTNRQYEFIGWYEGDEFLTRDATATFTNLGADHTYTARFQRYLYNISYTWNGGATNDVPIPYEYNIYENTTLPRVTRAYCTLNGGAWKNTSVTPNTYITTIAEGTSGDISLVAEWTGKSTTVKYNLGSLPQGDGGTITPSSYPNNTISYNAATSTGTKVTLPVPGTTNSSYEFYGWYRDANYTGNPISGSQDFGYAESEITLYARWYTVNLIVRPEIGQGASGNYDTVDTKVKPGTTYSLLLWSGNTDPPVYQDQYGVDIKQFQGWSTTSYGVNPVAAGGTINIYCEKKGDPGAIIPDSNGICTKNVTIYAIWDQLYYVYLTYKVNAEDHDAYWGSDTTDIADRSYVVSSTDPHKVVDLFSFTGVLPQHIDVSSVAIPFKGWSRDSTVNDAEFYNTGDHGKIITGDREMTDPADATVIPYLATDPFNIHLILYATWPGRHTILFMGNNPWDIGDVIITLNNEFVDLTSYSWDTLPNGRLETGVNPRAKCNRSLFIGWYDQAEGGSLIDPTTTEFTMNKTLYAHWTPQYYITFSGPPNVTLSFNGCLTNAERKVDKLPTIPKDSVCYIVSWYTVTINDVKEIVDTDYQFDGDTTVFANYIASFKITFDPNGGNCGVPWLRTNATYQIDTYPNVERPGYTLDADGTKKGWYYLNNPTVPVTQGTVYEEDTTLFAKWLPKNYNVVFDPNGGSFSQGATITWTGVQFGKPFNYIPNQSVTRGDFPIPTPPLGSTLQCLGWSNIRYDADQGEPNVVASQNFDNETYQTLFAVWRTGAHVVTFNAMGGSVEPAKSVTNIDGYLSYYPIAYRPGYEFLGWYNWPIYYSNSLINQENLDQTEVWNAYFDASGISDPDDAINYTVLVNTNGPITTQYQLVDEFWNDVTDRVFTVYYFEYEDTITLTNGQSEILNNLWRCLQETGGWEQMDTVPLTVTYTKDGGPFESARELFVYDVVPLNNDVAEVIPTGSTTAYYFKFKIPYGVSLVLVHENQIDTKVYTWKKNPDLIIDGLHVDGRWSDTTNAQDTIILPNRKYTENTMIYAHWNEMPFPPTTSNTCYIERRLNANTADTIRIYMPVVKSITDTITTSLIQKDTLMFGYENKFLSDMGTSRRLNVTFERPNPMPYDDLSQDTTRWSNAKWYDMLVKFTDYWQNFGRDPLTGSMIGGFRFHYIPVAHLDDDDRVNYSDVYPVIDKNVFLVGVMEADFTPASLTFTMQLAIGAMTSDGNSSGYEITLKSKPPGALTTSVYTTTTPDGLDFMVPEKPIEWTAPEGYMFTGWNGPNNSTYSPGMTIAYDIIAPYLNSTTEQFALEAVWSPPNVCMIITRDYEAHIGNVEEIVTIDRNTDTKEVTLTYKCDVIADILMIGGGGGGAGGEQTTESCNVTDNGFVNGLLEGAAKIFTGNLILSGRMSGGGGGGSGETVSRSIYVGTGDVMRCNVGEGGGTHYVHDLTEDWFHWHFYREGYEGGKSEIAHTFSGYNDAPEYYTANGGLGGEISGKGGAQYFAGGTGASDSTSSTSGSTVTTGPKGKVGAAGRNKDGGYTVIAAAKTYWFGGGGGGAAPLNHKFKIGNTYLTQGATNNIYRSEGGNAASNGDNAGPAKFGGGGGGGCGGYMYQDGGFDEIFNVNLLPIPTNFMNPSSGADGVIFIQLVKRGV